MWLYYLKKIQSAKKPEEYHKVAKRHVHNSPSRKGYFENHTLPKIGTVFKGIKLTSRNLKIYNYQRPFRGLKIHCINKNSNKLFL